MYIDFWQHLAQLREEERKRKLRRSFTSTARRHSFNLGWALGRVFQIIDEYGTQNAKGEWKVVYFQEPLGAKIAKPRRRR